MSNPTNNLSPRQTQVMRLIADGKSNKEIAADLSIDLATVKAHVLKLYKKLGVKNRVQATNKFMVMHKR